MSLGVQKPQVKGQLGWASQGVSKSLLEAVPLPAAGLTPDLVFTSTGIPPILVSEPKFPVSAGTSVIWGQVPVIPNDSLQQAPCQGRRVRSENCSIGLWGDHNSTCDNSQEREGQSA